MFLEINKNVPIPQNLPAALEAAIVQLKESKDQTDCLQKAYQLLTTKYHGRRVKTYLRIFDLFFADINELWERNGFLHCTNMNYLLRVLLVKSGFFKDEDITARWTLIWYMSPHQYLVVRLATGKNISVDMWSKSYGIALGNYAHGFNSQTHSA